jgi:uncharacterized membrane protein YqaE (UPF0057 family)
MARPLTPGLIPKVGVVRMDLIRIILAILLQALGVFLQVGLGGQFWLKILLTLLGYVPGIVHAIWIIARRRVRRRRSGRSVRNRAALSDRAHRRTGSQRHRARLESHVQATIAAP